MSAHPTAPASPRIPGRRFLHSPGPTPIPDAVLAAMALQPMDLADPRVNALIDDCERGLLALMHAPPATALMMYAANGHGAWEAVVANLLGPGRAALIPGTGHFSDSWSRQAEGLGARVLRTPYTEGLPIDAAAVAQLLREDRGHDIAALFAVHTDTASGTTSDLAALRAALDAAGHPALLVVDAVASLAAVPLDMAALGADVVLGASQKGLMVPPGLAFMAVGERALAAARANPAPRYYWDWVRRVSGQSYGKFCGTPPLALLMGLRAALGLIGDEGLEAVLARHRRLAGAVHAAVARWSEGGALRFFCTVPTARSVSVTAVAVAPGIDPEALRTVARERFQVAIAGGLGPLAGRVFRIGHLGDSNEPTILGALAGVEAALAVQGIPHGRGGVEAAIGALTGASAHGGNG
jgi:alanine-glyoxylate transaminase/serine-glyoxylate transaminase/serine-pyruvate transaminase